MPSEHTQSLFTFAETIDIPVGPSGLAEELLRDVIAKRTALALKVTRGQCKSMESYADAVGGIRAYDWVLGFAQRKNDEMNGPQREPIEDGE